MIAFALTIFTGAFLLFQVQPLIAKYILPWFGGGPAVWTTCLLFFQVFLLGGYAYAHLSARWLRPRVQALVHLALVAAALVSLPIIPEPHWKPGDPEHPTGRILALLTMSVGLPYFVLSATGPLLQHWFSLARPGASPYRLYALPNVGSLLALMSYPFLFEPLFTRNAQAHIWAWGLGLYAICAAAAALRLWPHSATNAGPGNCTGGDNVEPAPSWTTQLGWLALPACASVLLLAITNKICQEVAVIPFLWVLPLGLYLLSFILCFDSPHWYLWKFYLGALVPSVGLLCFLLFERRLPLLIQVVIHAWALFNCCMVCHGELYRLRPGPGHLTRFYLMIAAGGALGGLIVAVLAPLALPDFYELPGGLVLLAGLLTVMLRNRSNVRVAGRPLPAWRVAAAAGVVLVGVLAAQAWHGARQNVAVRRNFYGVLRVVQQLPEDPLHRALELRSGPIMHGVQVAHPAYHLAPISYYHERSGLGMAFEAMAGDLPCASGWLAWAWER